jgi:hypothetical protein
MSERRGDSLFKHFILVGLTLAIWRAFVFALAVSWRMYKKSLALVSGRPLAHCRSLYLTPALVLSFVAWGLVLSGLLGFAGGGNRSDASQSVVALLSGTGFLFVARLLIRRGCL